MKSVASELMVRLAQEGYTHCFFVPGGGSMHLLEAASRVFNCVPFVNEVSAAIAAEYFTAVQDGKRRAFALVTSGPGVTNAVTGLAGAYLESRELLVVAGQVKTTDLADGLVRQRGIQEVDGIAATAAFTVEALSVRSPDDLDLVDDILGRLGRGRKGPAFIEVCLDIQASGVPPKVTTSSGQSRRAPVISGQVDEVEHDGPLLERCVQLLKSSSRPLLLVGGGVPRSYSRRLEQEAARVGLPVATTWNALDRVAATHPIYFGRPDTWGMRWSNLLIQQSDLLIAVGARLGLQQTGFNWQEFCPVGKVIHVDIDSSELAKPHPAKHLTVQMDSVEFLEGLFGSLASGSPWSDWISYGREVERQLPLDDPSNETAEGFVSPYAFAKALSDAATETAVVVPCSSGGASTVMMQAFEQKAGQCVINNRALASMGYGLAGAIGAALAYPDRPVFLTEGDGGFLQNLSELGTVEAQQLNLKIFIFANDGYASIRMTQRNYFEGNYLGCDESTGLGIPRWRSIAEAYDMAYLELGVDEAHLRGDLSRIARAKGPMLVVVPLDPEQTYFPKISSRLDNGGQMASAPLHLMSPDLSPDLYERVSRYLPTEDE